MQTVLESEIKNQQKSEADAAASSCDQLEICKLSYDPDPRILAVLEFIDHAPPQEVTIEAAAEKVNLSVSRLRHLFKQGTAMPFHTYVRIRRMQRARALITGSLLRIKEVAAFVGAPDVSHFVRDYRRFYGVAPSRHRQLQRKVKSANK